MLALERWCLTSHFLTIGLNPMKFGIMGSWPVGLGLCMGIWENSILKYIRNKLGR